MVIQLFGHPFSSYTWKAEIALYENDTPFEFRMVDPEHTENSAELARRSALDKFPLLVEATRNEATGTRRRGALHRVVIDDMGEARVPRWAKIGGLVLLVLVGGAVVVVAVAWTRLPEIVADRASKATGRPVKIGTLRLSPGRWVGVVLQDASLGNLPGGTRPEMARVGSVAAEVALWPLLHGTVVARGLKIEHADILLEKVNGQPNWRNGPKQPEAPGGGRADFPTLLGADVQGVLTFRTTSGHDLVTELDGVTLASSSAAAPVRVSGPGSYQGVPITMDLGLGSYDQLHDATVPFPTDVRMSSGDTVLHFVGTMTDPLNVDGADGTISVVAPTPEVLEKVAGVEPSPAPSLRLEGAFQHERDSWLLQQAKGALGDAPLERGTLHYVEGNSEAKTPDKVETTLKFGDVDVDRLMAAFKGGSSGGGSGRGGGFVPEASPNPLVSATVAATAVSYNKLKLTAPKLSVAVAPNLISVDKASVGVLGGQMHADGRVRGEGGKTGTLSATLAGTGLEVSQLRQALGAGKLPLAGRMDLHAVVEGSGATAMAALEAGRGSLVATMSGGSVSQQMVELASTDAAGLLRSSKAMIPLECILAVAELRGGVATVGPVRLRSSQGTIMARGQIDVLRNTLDVVVASEARTTGAIALDIPVRVSGRFGDPSIVPAGSGADRSTLSSAIPRGLAAPLRVEAERSACAR